MKHTREEIITALHIIKDTCSEFDCGLCPFSDGDGYCIVAEQAPSAWNIKSDEPWRAFE